MTKPEKPSLAYVCTVVPKSPSNGIRQTNYELLKRFKRDFNVTLILLLSPLKKLNVEQLEEELDVTIIRPDLSLVSMLKIFRGGLKPAQSIIYSLFQIPNTKFCYGYGSTIRSAPYLDGLCSEKKILNFADDLSKSFAQKSTITKNYITKFFLLIESFLLGIYQRQLISKFTVCFSFDNDFSGTTVLPHGSQFEKQPNRRCASGKEIVFFGNLRYWPNKIALFDFIKLAKNCEDSDFKFIVIGDGFDKFKNIKLPSNLVFLGFIDDLHSYLNNAFCSISFIRFGGGIQNKVIDSLFCGCPVIISENLSQTGHYDIPGVSVANNLEDAKNLLYNAKIEQVDLSVVKENFGWDLAYEKICSRL